MPPDQTGTPDTREEAWRRFLNTAYDAYMDGDDLLPQYQQDAPFEEKEEDLPPEAREVPRPVRRMIRNAHRNL